MTSPSVRAEGSDFAPLLRAVRTDGLLEPRRGYYAALLGFELLLFALVWSSVVIVGDSWWTLLLAVPAALTTMRIVFIGHDAGHGQITRNPRAGRVLNVLVGDLLSGLGSRWWIDKHSRHHANPNQVGKDPDVAPGALAWTPEQALARRTPFGRWVAANQAFLYPVMLLGEAVNLRVASFRAVRTVRDVLLLCAHTAAYLGLLLVAMSPGKAAVFFVIHQALVGVHLGIAFAPNHKGMPMPAPGERTDFLRKQVVTSRNVSGGHVIDWFMGGLNHQIEHHLFPSMPRPNLRAAKRMVRRYCEQFDLPYTEETLRSSLLLTLRHLHAVGAPLRHPLPAGGAIPRPRNGGPQDHPQAHDTGGHSS